jgi:hypothetical protein
VGRSIGAPPEPQPLRRLPRPVRVNRLPFLLSAIVVAPGLCGVASASSRPGGVAPIHVPRATGGYGPSTAFHLAFRVSNGAWHQAYDRENTGAPSFGMYTRSIELDGRACDLVLGVTAQVQDRRPRLLRFGKPVVVDRGRKGDLHWLLARATAGPVPTLFATAYRPAPRSLTTKRYLSITSTVNAQPGASAKCGRVRDGVNLAFLIRNISVRSGAPAVR